MTGRLTLVCFIGLFALAVMPLLSAPIPPLFDYPNHLGRMAILAADGRDFALNRYYEVRWGMLPNLGMDAVVPRLADFMPLVEAGRVFLIATLFLMAAGPVLLSRVWWGAWSPWACAGFLFLYSRVFLWGFVNYLAGIGLAFWALSGWVLLERRCWLLRGLVGGVAATIVYFCHIEAFGVLALMLVGVEVAPCAALLRRRDYGSLGGRAGALGLTLLPGSLLFLVIWQPQAGGLLVPPRLARKPDLLFSVFDNYSRGFDVTCFVVFICLCAVGFWFRRLRLIDAARWPLLAIGAVYLALPSTLLTGAGADHRLPLVLFLLLAAATRPLDLSSPRLAFVASALLALFVARMAVIEVTWRSAAEVYRQDLALLARLPEGVRLAVAAPSAAIQAGPAPEYHLPVLAIPLRKAFVPTLFAYPSQQPVGLKPVFRELAAASDPARLGRGFAGVDPESETARRIVIDQFDAIVFIGRVTPVSVRFPCLRLVGETATIQLYTIEKIPLSCVKN